MRVAGSIIVTCLVLSGLTGGADAGDHAATENPPPRRNQLYPKVAMALSGGFTAGLIGGGYLVLQSGGDQRRGLGGLMLLTGTVFGPSVGLWYAGRGGGYGILVRLGGAALGTYGLVEYHDSFGDDRTATRYLVLAGGAVAVVSAAWDVVSAGDAAADYNVRNGFTVAPTVVATPTGHAPGLVVAGAF